MCWFHPARCVRIPSKLPPGRLAYHVPVPSTPAYLPLGSLSARRWALKHKTGAPYLQCTSNKQLQQRPGSWSPDAAQNCWGIVHPASPGTPCRSCYRAVQLLAEGWGTVTTAPSEEISLAEAPWRKNKCELNQSAEKQQLPNLEDKNPSNSLSVEVKWNKTKSARFLLLSDLLRDVCPEMDLCICSDTCPKWGLACVCEIAPSFL